MSDPVASMSPEQFIPLLRVRIFSDEEIAHRIRSNQASAKRNVELIKAFAEARGGSGPITGIVGQLCASWRAYRRLRAMTRKEQHKAALMRREAAAAMASTSAFLDRAMSQLAGGCRN